MRQSKSLVSHKNADKACVYKKVSGSGVVFLVLYVDDILLNGNIALVLQFVNILVIHKYFP